MTENSLDTLRSWLAGLEQLDGQAIANQAIQALLQLLEQLSAAVSILITDGGPITHCLLILAALAVLITLVKFLQLSWHRGPRQKALKQLARQRGPVGRVLEVAMHGLIQPQPSVGRVGEQARQTARAQLAAAQHYLVLLKFLAIAGPLLGLLGTVLMLIDTLRQLEQTAAAAVASGPLWRALLPSATGLGLGIFATAAYLWLSRRIARCEAFIHAMLGRIFSRISELDHDLTPLAPPVSPPLSLSAQLPLRASGEPDKANG